MAEIVNVAWDAAVNVKVALELVADEKLASAAFVATIKHVPAVVAVRVAVDVASESAQVADVPPAKMANVVAPVPLPPLVVMDRACE